MTGGIRRGAGRPTDPNSMRSQIKGLAGKQDWVTLPAAGREGETPVWPLEMVKPVELDLWAKLWVKPQALMWEHAGLEFTVAHYVRTFFEAAEPGATAGVKSAAIRLEAELGISLPGMKMLGWQIGEIEQESRPAARKTSSGDWLQAVSVEGS